MKHVRDSISTNSAWLLLLRNMKIFFLFFFSSSLSFLIGNWVMGGGEYAGTKWHNYVEYFVYSPGS
jgi:hypothetical protein